MKDSSVVCAEEASAVNDQPEVKNHDVMIPSGPGLRPVLAWNASLEVNSVQVQEFKSFKAKRMERMIGASVQTYQNHRWPAGLQSFLSSGEALVCTPRQRLPPFCWWRLGQGGAACLRRC